MEGGSTPGTAAVALPSSQQGGAPALAPSFRLGGAIPGDGVEARFRGGVEELLAARGGSDTHVIRKVLIANNGIAAVKAIRSIRQWSYDTFGNEREVCVCVRLRWAVAAVAAGCGVGGVAPATAIQWFSRGVVVVVV